MPSRLLTSSLATAVAVAAAVTAGAASADAASSTTTLGPVQYDCAGGALKPRATFVIQQPESTFDTVSAPAGENLATLMGGSIPFSATLQLPAATVKQLQENGDDSLGGQSKGTFTLGASKGRFRLSIPATDVAPAANGSQTVNASGAITSLPLTGKGKQRLKFPKSVSLALISGAKTLSCTLDTSTPAATPLVVTVAPAKVTAKARGARVIVTATDGAGDPGHGKVTASFSYRARGRTRTATVTGTLKNGRATLGLARKLAAAKLRRAKVKVTFAGASAKPVTVRR